MTALFLANWGALSEEIVAMHAADQRLRNGWIQEKSEELSEEILMLDLSHQERLREIIREHGWVGSDAIGQESAHALWLLVQHAPDLDFQQECLSLLKQAAKRGEAALADYAFLQDRVLVRMGEKQIYGTQTAIVEGQVFYFPIEDEENVEIRRFEMGLNTLWEQAVETTKRYLVKTGSEQKGP